jgi:small multidrug resistance pump
VAVMPWLQLAVAIVAEVIGTTFLKLSAGLTKPLPTLVVVIAYGLSFWLLSRTLEVIPVGVAYAVWSGAGVALIAAIGWAALGQKLDAAALVGMGLIVAGVVVLNLFSTTAAH